MSEEDTDLPVDTAPAPSPKENASLLAKLRMGALIVAAGLVLFVVARNWDPVTIDLFRKKIDLPKSLLVILTFIAGAACGVLLAYLRPWRTKKG
jgi:uncharacterized integral membrane protein